MVWYVLPNTSVIRNQNDGEFVWALTLVSSLMELMMFTRYYFNWIDTILSRFYMTNLPLFCKGFSFKIPLSLHKSNMQSWFWSGSLSKNWFNQWKNTEISAEIRKQCLKILITSALKRDKRFFFCWKSYPYHYSFWKKVISQSPSHIRQSKTKSRVITTTDWLICRV